MFLGMRGEWKGTYAIFVVVDMFSKLAKFALTQINAIVAGMAKMFFDLWVQHNGILEVIMNNRNVKIHVKILDVVNEEGMHEAKI
jgi:hypothetical protein